WGLGLCYIVAIAVIWSAASVLVQYVLVDRSFSPFVLTYICNSLFIVCFPVYFGSVYCGWARNPSLRETGASDDGAPLVDGDNGDMLGRIPAPTPKPLLSHSRTARLALMMAPLWFIAQYGYNGSLALTSVTSSTIIGSTSSLFTLVFSWICIAERLTPCKVAGVALCLAGSVVVALGDHHVATGAATLSASAYGGYTTLLRAGAAPDRETAMGLLLGYLGLFLVVALAPAAIAVLVLSPETRVALTPRVLGLVVVKGLFDNVLSDFLWARAVVLTSPVVATVGLSLTIPMAFVTDFVLRGAWPRIGQLAGAAAVIGGFLAVN
ncbi:unnamed protein product, partial [Phaeothamnion confervicola]